MPVSRKTSLQYGMFPTGRWLWPMWGLRPAVCWSMARIWKWILSAASSSLCRTELWYMPTSRGDNSSVSIKIKASGNWPTAVRGHRHTCITTAFFFRSAASMCRCSDMASIIIPTWPLSGIRIPAAFTRKYWRG